MLGNRDIAPFILNVGNTPAAVMIYRYQLDDVPNANQTCYHYGKKSSFTQMMKGNGRELIEPGLVNACHFWNYRTKLAWCACV